MNVLYIAIGGATGAVLRYWVSNGAYALFGRGFPYGTLSVNIIGSLIMGILYVVLVERVHESAELRAALIVGLLGAFTTFSTFSIDTINLIESGEQLKAGLNIVCSVVLCVLGCWLGMLAARQIY